MIRPDEFIENLRRNGIDFFTGVPDSLLKNLCAYITDTTPSDKNIIAANEGNAIALAAGYYLATDKAGCVYMQNSGEGNAINPLLSLVDSKVYAMPMLLIIGWRGEPGTKDEPQHIKQGEVTLSLLKTLGIDYVVLDNSWQTQVENAINIIKATHSVYALVVRKGTFSEYTSKVLSPAISSTLSRERAIQVVVDELKSTAVVVSTTGMISRELFEYREQKNQGHGADFLTVGSMGHASQIALTIALQKPDRKVYVFDGDGALLMHMGGMAIIGDYCPKNMVHIVFNNGAHDSVGGQPTVGHKIDIPAIAKAVGYTDVLSVDSESELKSAMKHLEDVKQTGVALINVIVCKGNRPDLGRPTTTPIQNKLAFMSNIKH